jgi:hypothetical protein
MNKKVISAGKFFLYTDSHKIQPYVGYSAEDLSKIARDRIEEITTGQDLLSMYINNSKKELDYKEELKKVYNEKLMEFNLSYIEEGNIMTTDNPSMICRNDRILSLKDKTWEDYFVSKISEDKKMIEETIKKIQEDLNSAINYSNSIDIELSYFTQDRIYEELNYYIEKLIKLEEFDTKVPNKEEKFIFEIKPIADYLIDSNNRCISLEEMTREDFIKCQKDLIFRARDENSRLKEYIISIDKD